MDLRLRCSCPGASFDVALDVEPGHPLADVRDALIVHARTIGVDVDPNAGLTAAGRELDLADTVFSAGLATGHEVGLGIDPADVLPAPFRVRVAVVSGPDAGTVVLLDVGRHTIGRHPSCAVPLTDPSVADEHALVDVRSDAALRVVSAGPVVTLDEEDLVDGAREIAAGSTVRVGSSVLEMAVVGRARPTDVLGTVAHNRTPYRRQVVHPRVLAPLDKPPEVATKPRFVLASALLPVASGGMLVVISGRVQFLFLVLLSPLLLGWSFLQDRRSGRRRYELERDQYRDEISARVSAGELAKNDELIERRRAAPAVRILADHAEFLQPRLWERDRTTADFGELRVGVASQRSDVSVDIASGGDDSLVREARTALEDLSTISGVPVSVGLDADRVLALVGAAAARNDVARSLVAQAATLHSPEDLVVSAMVAGGSLAEHEWLKWLPHVRSSSSPLEGPTLAMWPDEHERLLVDLANLAEARDAADDSPGWPRLLVLIDEAVEPDRTVLSRVLDRVATAGIWVVWIGESADRVPRQAEVLLQCGADTTASVLDWRDVTRHAIEIVPDRCGLDEAMPLARALAPLRDATSATQVAAIPRIVPLYDVLPGGRPDGRSISDRWSAPADGLAVAVGIGTDGHHVLDLVEQGPHALIAGTSGAGKSEFLQTWVAALAAAHPPERLNLLFIDYKGGAFAAPFDGIPHHVGTVTNLDEALSLRALTSLRAELDRRMHLLGGDAKDIVEMQAIDPAAAPPRLVIIVDEFATLVKEIPDFVAGMVDLAQRGRSLGIHLVLATQRPSGSVNDNILANTNLRISLRVLDAADSTSIIGAPDAAELPAPLRGRAFARTGPGQLHPFQSAYAGALDLVQTGPGQIGTGSFDFSGVLASGGAEAGSPERSRTQLSVVTAAIAEAASRSSVEPARRPWLEPLAEVVSLSSIVRTAGLRDAQRSDPGRAVTIGLVDRPAEQTQDAWTVDLESSGGLLVFGGGGSGRTTVLRTIAAELEQQAHHGPVETHVIDAASRALGPLGALPTVGSVLSADELEPIARLVEVLEQEVVDRRSVLAGANADSLSTLRSMASDTVVPRIVVLIDGLASLRETLDTPDAYEWFNRLVRLTSDGRQVGIHFVATSDRRAGLPASMVGSLGTRLVLRMPDADDAIGLGVPRPIASRPDTPAGRGFADDSVVQVAVVSEDPRGPGQSEAIIALGGTSVADPARDLPELPDRLDTQMEAIEGLLVAVGDQDLSPEPAVVDLGAGHLIVTGPGGSARSSVLAGIALAVASSPARPRLIGVGAPSSPLAALDVFDEAAFNRSEVAELGEAVAATVDPEARTVEAIVFVDAAEDVAGIDTDRALERLTALASVRLVVVADAGTLARSFSGWLAEVKRQRRMLLLQPESKAEIDSVLGMRVPLRPGQQFPVGRGLLAAGRDVTLVQVRSGSVPAGNP